MDTSTTIIIVEAIVTIVNNKTLELSNVTSNGIKLVNGKVYGIIITKG